MSQSVADLVKQAMARKRRPDGRPWGPYQLMGAIGLLEGDRPFNITQVQRLLSDQRRTYSHQLIRRLIEVLDFTDEEADELWFAAGLWPPDLDVAGYRRFRHHLAAVGAVSDLRDPKNGPSWRHPAQRRSADRRRRDRRQLRLLPAEAVYSDSHEQETLDALMAS